MRRAITSCTILGWPVSCRALHAASNAWPIAFVAASSKTPRGRNGIIDATCAPSCAPQLLLFFKFRAMSLWAVPFGTISPLRGEKGPGMCESCVGIDARIDLHRQWVRPTTYPSEIERINRLIAQLYVDRMRLHQNAPSGLSICAAMQH